MHNTVVGGESWWRVVVEALLMLGVVVVTDAAAGRPVVAATLGMYGLCTRLQRPSLYGAFTLPVFKAFATEL